MRGGLRRVFREVVFDFLMEGNHFGVHLPVVEVDYRENDFGEVLRESREVGYRQRDGDEGDGRKLRLRKKALCFRSLEQVERDG